MRLAKDDLVEKATETGRDLARQASGVVESGKEQAKNGLREKKNEAAAQVHDLDQALRQTAQEVDNPGMARQIERLADGVERFANTLETTELDEVLLSTEQFARQSPMLFMAGSFALGMAAARFLRSSSRRVHPLVSGYAVNP